MTKLSFVGFYRLLEMHPICHPERSCPRLCGVPQTGIYYPSTTRQFSALITFGGDDQIVFCCLLWLEA